MVNQRKVTEEQGIELATRLKVPYIETSAKDPPINVDTAFHELVRIVKSFPNDEDNEPQRFAGAGGAAGGKTKRRKNQKCLLM